MEELIRAVFDLCKFQLMSFVNTGDRSIDACIQVIIMTFIQMCTKFITEFASKFSPSIWIRRLRRNNGFLQPDEVFTLYDIDKLKYHIVVSSNIALAIKNKRNIEFENVDRPIADANYNYISSYEEIRKYTEAKHIAKACFFYNGHFSGIYQKGDHIYSSKYTIVSDSLDTIKEMIRDVEKEIKPEEKPVVVQQKTNYIFRYESGSSFRRKEISILKPEITFDTFYSRYKPSLIDLLTRFKEGKMNTHIHRHRTNNLGFLLSGEPGVGKTTMIKAIANFLGRSIFDINFKRDKIGRSELEDLLTGKLGCLSDFVFVLEEFDLVQDVIRRNYDTSNINDTMLKKTAMLTQISNCTDEGMRKKLLDEYSRMDDEKLCLGSLLTILDGIVDVNNRIIIATTNNPEMIDPALKRPGRLGFNLRLPYFNREEMIDMFTDMLQPSEADLEWLKRQELPGDKWAPCELLQEMQVYPDFREYVNHIVHTEPPRLNI